jgi:anti-anti-sigma factor
MRTESFSPLLQVETTGGPNSLVVRCQGEIDLSSAEYLERALSASIAAGAAALEVDLRGVRYFDSSAIKALLEARERLAAEGGRLSVRAQPTARALLRVLRLDRALNLQAD